MRLPAVLAPLVSLALSGLLFVSAAHAQDRDGGGESAMLARINELRAQAGQAALTRDARLDEAAARHSAEMAARDVLEHVSEGSGTPADRVRAAGLDIQEIAENVAMHTSAAEAQSALEGSDAHLTNMLNPRFTHVGLAAVRDGAGFYVTQVFGRVEPTAPEAATSGDAAAVPQVVIPPVTAPQVVEAQPQVVEVQPQATVPQTGGSVVMIPRTDARVTGYWVCSGGRWWYYPMPAGATSGTRLAPDLSVTGGPPGYGASACAAGQSVAVSGVPQVQPPPPPVQPYGQPPQYYSVDPYGRAVVVRPGVIIAPYGSGGVRIEWGTRPRPYGRVRGRWR